jgi:MFS family permease
VGVLLAAILLGTALASYAVGRFGDGLGRRRTYLALFAGLAVAGAIFGTARAFPILIVGALVGTISTEVVESGPFTSLEQAMLPLTVPPESRTRVFGVYNAIATLAGSAGALAAGGSALLRRALPGVPAEQRLLLAFVPVGMIGALLATRLSDRVEEGRSLEPGAPRLGRSRATVRTLAGLFMVDSLAGGFVVQSFLVYWFRLRFGVSIEALGVVFFSVGILQSLSFVAATRIADRFGLLNTMVFTHLPSNLLLAAIPFAPNFPVAVALLFVRFALSQMDVPTRQAYVVGLVDPEERTAAVAYTNTARYAVRPFGALLGGVAQGVSRTLPFAIAGGAKAAYDLALWMWFRTIRIDEPARRETSR